MRDVVDSMHGWLLRANSFVERAEVALARLSLAPIETSTPPMLPPRNELDADFTGERVVELYGSFSPRARATSSADCVCDSVVVDVAPVLQILPELQRMCEVSVLPPSSEHLKVGSLVTSVVADLAPTTAPLEPSLMTTFEEGAAPDRVAMQSHESIEQVTSSSGKVNKAEEICDLLSKLDVAIPGLGRSIACLLTGTPIKDKIKKVCGGSRNGIRKKSLGCKDKKGAATGKASMTT
jgi:hypothetical protein